jgi:hypothetical protein
MENKIIHYDAQEERKNRAVNRSGGGMNSIAIIHLIAGIAIVAVSLPLIKRRIRMNAFYGFRIDAAFESDQRWYDINAYGGRMFFRWGLAITIAGLIGLPLPQKFWLIHAYVSVVIVLGGLSISVLKTLRYADQLKKS